MSSLYLEEWSLLISEDGWTPEEPKGTGLAKFPSTYYRPLAPPSGSLCHFPMTFPSPLNLEYNWAGLLLWVSTSSGRFMYHIKLLLNTYACFPLVNLWLQGLRPKIQKARKKRCFLSLTDLQISILKLHSK